MPSSMGEDSPAGYGSGERRLTELGTGNWNNRGIDNHIKRPAGVSSAGLKRNGTKRIDGIPHPVGCGNTSDSMEKSLKYPQSCLIHNEQIYDGNIGRKAMAQHPNDPMLAPAGIEASKTVQFQNYAALSDKERDGPQGGKVPSWLVGQQTKRRVAAPWTMNGDPIAHDYVVPHKQPSRPLRRMGLPGSDSYDNAASRHNWNLQKQQLNTGPLDFKGMTREEWKAVSPRVHLSPLGEVHTTLGGLEDMKPTCTNEYTKADKPATLVTRYENDKRELAGFERDCVSKVSIAGRHVSAESPDMLKAMFHFAPSSRGSKSEYQQNFIEEERAGDSQSIRKGDYGAPSEISMRSGDPAWNLRPDYAPGPMSARSGSKQSASFDQGRPRSGPGSRTPMSARGSGYREAGNRYERSIASTYYSESEGLVRNGERRSAYSGTPLFSDPGNTVSGQALTDAIRRAR